MEHAIDAECLICGHKTSNKAIYAHLKSKHQKPTALNVTYKRIEPVLQPQGTSTTKNARCLCKKDDGSACGEICKNTSIASHIATHHHINKIKLGDTHEWTTDTLTVDMPRRSPLKRAKEQGGLPILTAQSGYVEMLVRVQVPINIGTARIVND